MARGTCYPFKNTTATGNISIEVSEEVLCKLNTFPGDIINIEVTVVSGHEYYSNGIRIQKNYEEVFIEGISIEEVVTDIVREDIYPKGTKIKISGIIRR